MHGGSGVDLVDYRYGTGGAVVDLAKGTGRAGRRMAGRHRRQPRLDHHHDPPWGKTAESLARGFTRLWLGDDAQANKWVRNFVEGSDLTDLAEAACERLAAQTGDAAPTRMLLYVDQGEELYVRSEAAQAERFATLLALWAAHPSLTILASLRSEFYGRFQDDAALFPACYRLDVPPLTRAQIEEVIRKPAARLGARFEFLHSGITFAKGASGRASAGLFLGCRATT